MKNMQFERMLDDRFGMFVHYGIYSAYAGNYKGQWITGLGEWIQKHAEIPIAEYEEYGKKYFHTSPDFAKNLVKSAKNAGIRYIVLTSKHHDGFCLFNSAVSDYNSYAFYGRDICRELADECRKEGLEVGFYYSHTLDWHEKDAAGMHSIASDKKRTGNNRNRNYWDYPDDNIDFEKYLTEKCIPQVKELLTNYGDLKLIWFDFAHDITAEQSKRLRDVVKSIQPNCLINSRIAFGYNDYTSLGDNALPVAPMGDNLECLVTLNDTWGYRRDDNNWKKPEEVLDILCRTLTGDASLLLNVGPMADGSLTSETHHILEEMGKWTELNADAVYGGVRGNPLPTTFPWGYAAVKGNDLYLYVKDKSAKKLTAAAIEGEICSVSVLGEDNAVNWSFNDGRLDIEAIDTELTTPVYRIRFKDKPIFKPEIVQFGNEIKLGVLWAGKVEKGAENSVPTKLPCNSNAYLLDFKKNGAYVNGTALLENWTDEKTVLCWDVKFTEPGVYEAEIIHALTNPYEDVSEIKGVFTLSIGDRTNAVDMESEKSQYKLSKSSVLNIRVVRDAGKFEINLPGTYRVLFAHDGAGDNIPISDVKFVKIG